MAEHPAAELAPRRLGHGLLVSVRNAAEAVVAASAGAAIIDVKEPSRGPLGRADPEVAAAVAAALAATGSAAGLTLACGELAAGCHGIIAHVRAVVAVLPPGCRGPLAVKAGPAGLSADAWVAAFTELVASLAAGVLPVAVAYADWHLANAAPPSAIVAAAAAAGATAVLVDTFAKQGPGLFEVAAETEVRAWVDAAATAGMTVALAGRLDVAGVALARALGAHIAGVRSAACRGGRMGRVDATLVRSLARLSGSRPVLDHATGARRP